MTQAVRRFTEVSVEGDVVEALCRQAVVFTRFLAYPVNLTDAVLVIADYKRGNLSCAGKIRQ